MEFIRMNNTANLSERQNAMRELVSSQQTLLFSTASLNGEPDLGYAPFVRDESGCFYVFISELAVHTANLLVNPQATVMFIRSEAESGNLFARERVVFNCTVREIKRSEDNYSRLVDSLQDQFGEIVGVLRALADFHLFTFKPDSGRYVAGFGQAYTINSSDWSLSPLRKGHK
jgi:heme iron utilization protein